MLSRSRVAQLQLSMLLAVLPACDDAEPAALQDANVNDVYIADGDLAHDGQPDPEPVDVDDVNIVDGTSDSGPVDVDDVNIDDGTSDSGPVDVNDVNIADAAPPAPLPGVVISEALAINDGVLRDADGDSADWVELYNPGPDGVDLGGWSLTDDPDDPRRFVFPAQELGPASFVVVFASGKVDGSADPAELHAPFRLSGDGETLLLVAPDGRVADRLEIPAQRVDVSFGRGQEVRRAVLADDGAPARAALDAPAGWATAAFDDGAWRPVRLPVGFDGDEGAGPAMDLALGAPTRQSTDGYGRSGIEAVDGDVRTFTHTADGDLEPWWEVDLGARSRVGSVRVVNRVGCCNERLYNLDLTLVDDDGAVTWAPPRVNVVAEGEAPGSPGPELRFELDPPAVGVRLRVGKTAVGGPGSTEWMSLAEVQVMGTPASPYADRLGSDLGEWLHGVSDRAFLRIPLDPAPFAAARLRLEVRYDDAFSAHLGPATVTRNLLGEAVGQPVEALAEAAVVLPPSGPGPLAVELRNVAADDDDLFFGVRVVAEAIETGALAWFPTPTPGAPNEGGVEGFVAGPTSDPPRGLFDDPPRVAIRTETPGATLVYTLDGSVPSAAHGVVVDDARAEVQLDGTAILRVVALRDGWRASEVATHTYVVPEQVLRQPALPPGLPETWHGLGQAPVAADYALDPEIVDDPTTAEDLRAGLRAIPSMSVVMPLDDLFGPDRGIYVHSTQRGADWERAASVEILDAANPGGFQAAVGVRIHGFGWRPHSSSLKHSLRLEFRKRYGPTHLEYPLFADAPIDRFDSIVLRAQGSRSWQDFRDPAQAQYTRDAFARDTAREMGKVDGHATYVHLYLNGLYWGLYMPVERPDADFGAAYFGGEPDEYDAVNRRTTTNEAIDGTLDAYLELLRRADGPIETDEGLAAVAELIDLDDLVDYMLVHQYTANRDGPELFNHNNMRGVRRRAPDGRFRFFVWDMEYSLWFADDDINVDVDVAGSVSHVYARLRTNAAFRARYAARARMHLTGEGALTPAASIERYERRAREIEDAVLAESARWGDAARVEPYRRDVEWVAERERLLTEFFPRRTEVLIGLLVAAELFVP